MKQTFRTAIGGNNLDRPWGNETCFAKNETIAQGVRQVSPVEFKKGSSNIQLKRSEFHAGRICEA
jgi:hypothetical protein